MRDQVRQVSISLSPVFLIFLYPTQLREMLLLMMVLVMCLLRLVSNISRLSVKSNIWKFFGESLSVHITGLSCGSFRPKNVAKLEAKL